MPERRLFMQRLNRVNGALDYKSHYTRSRGICRQVLRQDLLSVYLAFTTRPRPKPEKVLDAEKEMLANEPNDAGSKVLKCCNFHRHFNGRVPLARFHYEKQNPGIRRVCWRSRRKKLVDMMSCPCMHDSSSIES